MASIPVLAQRLTALGLFVLTIALLYAAVLTPVLARYQSGVEEISESRILLGRYEAALTQETQAGQGPDKAEAKNQAGAFLQGKSEALILASLQSRLKALAVANSARFQGARSLPIREDGTTRYVGVRLNITGTTQSLRDTMYAIETGLPFLFIENAHLRRQRRNSTGTVAAPVTIVAQLDVFGAIARKPAQ